MEAKNQLTVVKDILAKKLQEEASAIPKDFNAVRFLQNCMTVLGDTKDIDKCTPESIVSALIKGAYLGLDFFTRTCFAIPYNKNIGTKTAPKWVKSLQFQTSYTGDIFLSKKYSPVKIRDIYAKVVREEDKFDIYVEDGKQHINYKPIPFSDKPIIGAFAVVYYEDGSMLYDTMSQKEIEKTRLNYSKAPDSKAWKNSFAEMAKKTILKRICKLVTLNFDNPKQHEAFDDGSHVDPAKEVIDVAPETPDPFKGQLGSAKKEPEKPQVEEPEPEKPQPEKESGETNDGLIVQIQAEIEKYLKANKREASLVYKYSMDIYHKPLANLTLAEMKGLKDKILNNQI